MIQRDLANVLRDDAQHLPVLSIVGPRQSGKSTLARAVFPSHDYINLERPDLREEARADPRRLLARHPSAILDEVQNVPTLLSWVQAEVDERPIPGRYILTGSNQQALSAANSQTLAGRTSVSTLLPPDHAELQRFENPPADLWTALWAGAWPRVYDTGMPADRWLSSYVQTYLERDVRQLIQVGDLVSFSNFLRLSAGRTSKS